MGANGSKNGVKPVKIGDADETRVGNHDADVVDGSCRKKGQLTTAAYEQYMASVHDLKKEGREIDQIPYEDYEYPFENLVFEGGGAKGQVYIGCLQILEGLNMKYKRVAGASAGSLCAALTAIGYTAEEMRKVLESDLETILMDHSCGLCSLLPNLVRNFGWNPGQRFMTAMGKLIEDKGFHADLTFMELYKLKQVELCVTAVNLNMLSCEYFHPKTSPKVPIRLAVRMSLSIPGVFEAVKVKNSRGQTDLYIDGGLVCNYPIHAFDGWWLSMQKEDSFLHRIQPLSKLRKLMDKKERFKEYNHKTMGFVVYSALEQDLMQTELDAIAGFDLSDRPEGSALLKSRVDALKDKQRALDEHQVFLRSLEKFLKAIKGINTGNGNPGHQMDDVIDKAELKQALRTAQANNCTEHSDDDDDFAAHDVEILFGQNANIDVVFDDLDVDDNGRISYDELVLFVERAGIDIQSKFQGYDRREVNSLGQYVIGLQDTLLTNVKKMFLEDRDIERTVGINTDYIETMDFNMAAVDREFCYERGRKATVAFLKRYVHQNNPPKKIRSAVVDQPDNYQIQSVSRIAALSPAINPAASSPTPNSLGDGKLMGGRPTLPPIRGGKATIDGERIGHPAMSSSQGSLRHDSPATVSAINTDTETPAARERAIASADDIPP